jgi:hypothetical protein
MKIQVNKLWVTPKEIINPENFRTYALYLWEIQCLGICHGNG